MSKDIGDRVGRYVRQITGYRAFIPAPLPPDPPIALDMDLVGLLSRADRAIGRLDTFSRYVPNTNLIIAMYVRREAVDSSRIEGTQSSLDDVLAFELDESSQRLPHDVGEVVNYIRAMNHGLARLESLPLSLRLIREVHDELLRGTRGADKMPGEFRTTQNWIGAGMVPLEQARFVPPPPYEMHAALDDLERFMHHDHGLPPLVHCAIAHAQFETIHPFLDGNGRVGRLLITLQLVAGGVLHRPLLYLSSWLKWHRQEYYDRLMAVRTEGDWEAWIRYFLRGVAATAEEAVSLAQAIDALRSEHLARIHANGMGENGRKLLTLLFNQPVVNVQTVIDSTGASRPTVMRQIQRFVEIGLLEEITGQKRDRAWRYESYVDLFREQVDIHQTNELLQDTVSEGSVPS